VTTDLRAFYDNRKEGKSHRFLLTPEGTDLQLELATIGARLTALLLDVLLIFGIVFVIVMLTNFAFASAGEDWHVSFVILLVFFLRHFYFAWFELRWQGRTPGKRVADIRVVRRDGGALSADAVLARNLTRELELWMPLILLFFADDIWPDAPGWTVLAAIAWVGLLALMPFFNKDRLRMGDLIAGTMVITNPKTVLMPDIASAEIKRQERVGAAYRFTEKQLDVYGIYELQVLEDLLRDRNQQERLRAIVEVGRKIRKKIRWEGPISPSQDERFLREFYAALRARLEARMLLGERKADKHSG